MNITPKQAEQGLGKLVDCFIEEFDPTAILESHRGNMLKRIHDDGKDSDGSNLINSYSPNYASFKKRGGRVKRKGEYVSFTGKVSSKPNYDLTGILRKSVILGVHGGRPVIAFRTNEDKELADILDDKHGTEAWKPSESELRQKKGRLKKLARETAKACVRKAFEGF